MEKYDGSNVYFSTSGLDVNDVKDFFKDKISEGIFERIVSCFNMNRNKNVFIRVCPTRPNDIVLLPSYVEYNPDEEFYSQHLKKIVIPKINVADKISSLKKRIKELEEQLEGTKSVDVETVKQWVPKKYSFFANPLLNCTGLYDSDNSPFVPNYLTYPTYFLATNANKALLLHAKLLAYHAESYRDWETDRKSVV